MMIDHSLSAASEAETTDGLTVRGREVRRWRKP